MTGSGVAPPRVVHLPPGVPGSLRLHAMPGRAEPLDALWAWARDVALDEIVCLAGDVEIAEKSPAYAEALAAGSGPCAIERSPIPDFGVPVDAEAFRTLAARIAKRLREGRRILIHCGAGIGRTGTLAVCVLLEMGYTLPAAESAVRDAGSYPETPAQQELVAWCAARMSAVRGSDPPSHVVSPSYRVDIGDGRTTEALVEAGGYAYAHSCVTSDNFPARPPTGRRVREIVLIRFDRDVTSEDAILEAARRGLERPTYEDGLYFGAAHPDAQRDGPIVFLHDPWFGFFGRRDVLSLWENAGRRELGLEGFDAPWGSIWRFAFVRG